MSVLMIVSCDNINIIKKNTAALLDASKELV
jgi:hypothetical protein